MEMVIIFILGLLGIVIVLAWSVGLGWLITRLLPFTWFEGSLLSMAASVIVGYLATRVVSGFDIPFLEPEEPEDEIELPTYTIPATRFYRTEAEKTWEAWFKFEVANRLDNELIHAPRVTGFMKKAQRQELAVRLAEIGIALLKAKTGRAKQIQTRLADWRQQMTKQGLKPYDEAILRLAMTSLHKMVRMPTFERVVRAKLWDKPADMFDLVDEPLSTNS